MMLKQQKSKLSKWDSILRLIYGTPASVTLVSGGWKTGKTDFGLHLTEELKRLKLISICAGNIQCFEDKHFKVLTDEGITYIDNFFDLELWMFGSKWKKMFLYDEAIKSSPSKRAMSRLNTQWLKVIPELSKGRMHLVVITQEKRYTEGTFLHPTFNLAHWQKITLHRNNPQFRKLVSVSSKLFRKRINFRNVRPTSLRFDPYRSATFSMNPTKTSFETLPRELKVAMDYRDGLSTGAIENKYEDIKDRKEVTRLLRKGLIVLFNQWQVAQRKRRVNSSQTVPQKD